MSTALRAYAFVPVCKPADGKVQTLSLTAEEHTSAGGSLQYTHFISISRRGHRALRALGACLPWFLDRLAVPDRADFSDPHLHQLETHSSHPTPRKLVYKELDLRAAGWRTAAAATGSGSGLKELNKDSFHSFLEDAADTLVVVDFYTDWCVPS